MIDTDTALTSLTSELATALAGSGYARSGSAVIKRAPNGDSLVIELQESGFTRPDCVAFHVNLAAVPQSWLEYRRQGLDSAAMSQEPPTASDGMVKRRLEPENFYQVWEIQSMDEVPSLVRDIVATLRRKHTDFESLIDRQEFIRQIEEHKAKLQGLYVQSTLAELVLRADLPPTRGLAERKLDLEERASNGEQWASDSLRWLDEYRTDRGLALK